MSTLVVAKKEFRDGIRSRALLALVALFIVYTSFEIYSFIVLSPFDFANAHRRAADATSAMSTSASNFLPIVGTLVGYNAIAGERESGSLKLLLGLPHTRRDVVFGKVLGRSALLASTVLVGFAWGVVVIVWITGVFPPMREYATFVAVTILLGIVFVAIAIAFSSAVRSPTVATWGAVGLAIVFVFGWDTAVVIVRYVVGLLGLDEPPPGAPPWWEPPWQKFLWELNPTHAAGSAETALNQVLSGDVAAVTAGPTFGGSPFYLQSWFGFVILAFWLVVPLGLAHVRFRRMEFSQRS